jgi:hypothetical protein
LYNLEHWNEDQLRFRRWSHSEVTDQMISVFDTLTAYHSISIGVLTSKNSSYYHKQYSMPRDTNRSNKNETISHESITPDMASSKRANELSIWCSSNINLEGWKLRSNLEGLSRPVDDKLVRRYANGLGQNNEAGRCSSSSDFTKELPLRIFVVATRYSVVPGKNTRRMRMKNRRESAVPKLPTIAMDFGHEGGKNLERCKKLLVSN